VLRIDADDPTFGIVVNGDGQAPPARATTGPMASCCSTVV
jgi:hypothetical protein